eukprot:TRINITY_DN100563_c0_g1_i1.p1 TRINITY_DN100563_c0_g1~~TRINITY_DN100563_c0_g1_i1.p1  ORF type:complete len:242 (-),score=37.29 TRINITY_DN100563_c0_g1_i1:565-1290(-)
MRTLPHRPLVAGLDHEAFPPLVPSSGSTSRFQRRPKEKEMYRDKEKDVYMVKEKDLCKDKDTDSVSSTQFAESGEEVETDTFPPTPTYPSPLPSAGSWRTTRGLPRVATQSLGSSGHGRPGSCQPCAWYWKAVGCLKAQDCSYCHLCPEGEIKRRKKAKVNMLRQSMGVQETPQVTVQVAASESSNAALPDATLRIEIKNTFIHIDVYAALKVSLLSAVEDEISPAAGVLFAVTSRAARLH